MTERRLHSQSAIDQASAWVVRLGGDEVSDADYAALESWLGESPDHGPAFAEAQALWAALGDDHAALDAALVRAAFRTPLPQAARHSSSPRPSSSRSGLSRRRLWSAGLGVAAALAVALVIVPGLISRPQTYVTAPGEQRTIHLTDGTTIVMNGGSRLTVRLSDQERRVEMADAEAAFDVAHESDRPFRVIVGESQVEVLGTAFDVRRDAISTRVGVTRGVVRVSDLDDAAHNVRLTRGQAVTRSDATGRLDMVAGSTDPAGWRSGQLTYENRPLSEVVVDLSRAYATPLQATGGAESMRFTGVLVLDDQTEVVRRLEAFLPVRADRREGAIELRPR